jgi:hypothetical protein
MFCYFLSTLSGTKETEQFGTRPPVADNRTPAVFSRWPAPFPTGSDPEPPSRNRPPTCFGSLFGPSQGPVHSVRVAFVGMRGPLLVCGRGGDGVGAR